MQGRVPLGGQEQFPSDLRAVSSHFQRQMKTVINSIDINDDLGGGGGGGKGRR